MEIMKLLINNTKVEINNLTGIGDSILHYAITFPDAFKFLIQLPKINLNPIDVTGYSLVHAAAKYNSFEILEYFESSHPGVWNYSIEFENLNAIQIAAVEGHLETFKFLFGYYKMISHIKDEHDRNLLHLAAQNGKLSIVKFIIDSNEFNLKEYDEFYFTALHLAVRNAHIEIVQLLFNISYDIQYDCQQSVLHESLYSGSADIFKFISGKSEIDINQNSYKTVLEIAVKEHYDDDMLLIILQHPNINLNFRVFPHGTPIAYLVLVKAFQKNENPVLRKLMVDQKDRIDFGLTDMNNDLTMIHLSVINGEINVLEFLLRFSNPNIFYQRNKSNETALQIAIRINEQAFEKFQRRGIDLDSYDADAIFREAARCNNLKILQSILRLKPCMKEEEILALSELAALHHKWDNFRYLNMKARRVVILPSVSETKLGIDELIIHVESATESINNYNVVYLITLFLFLL